jgi:acyl-CoA thioester hydrolase
MNPSMNAYDENDSLQPLRLYRTTVSPDWIDYNGHMSEAYYVLVFGFATDAFYDLIGMDDAFRRATRTSVYTVEAHVCYLREATVGQALDIETLVLGHDAKRLALFHAMRQGPDGPMLATTELMVLNVNKLTLKTAPFQPAPMARIAEIAATHAGLPRPENAGRRIASL